MKQVLSPNMLCPLPLTTISSSHALFSSYAHLSFTASLFLSCSLLSYSCTLIHLYPVNPPHPFNGVWLRCCEWVRMTVNLSNPGGLVLISASVFGQCFTIQRLFQAQIKLSHEIKHLVLCYRNPLHTFHIIQHL